MQKPPIKGRGAISSQESRFSEFERESIDDGWFQSTDTPLATSVELETAKSIITQNQSPDIPFKQSINAYRGCEHGCIYCYARPSHAYLGLSPGLDFETQLTAKPNAAELLRKELQAKNYQCSPISLGANTDPYQPIEKQYQITRQILEVLLEYKHPCTIITKSSMIERDIELLSELSKHNLVKATISITTLQPDLARKLEPRASSPKRRLQTIETLSQAGIPVNVLIAPIIPVLTDPEMETIIDSVYQAGANSVDYIFLRLPREVADLFQEWLRTHFPDQAEHVMNRVKDSRGGKTNDARFGHRLRGHGIYADMINQRFHKAIKRYPPNTHVELNCTEFCQIDKQLNLF